MQTDAEELMPRARRNRNVLPAQTNLVRNEQLNAQTAFHRWLPAASKANRWIDLTTSKITRLRHFAALCTLTRTQPTAVKSVYSRSLCGLAVNEFVLPGLKNIISAQYYPPAFTSGPWRLGGNYLDRP
ncbi:hypothetical protein HHJ39_00095 [Escherichia coli]|nr:hypothetical protein HHJ39_00095 [Escherichia coli]